MSNARNLGNITTSGLTGDLNVDANTLVVDSTNNRVGIGSETPTTTLDISGTATATAFSGPLTGNVTGTTSSISNHDTDALSEGSTNLYYTNARADARAQLKIDALVDSAPGTLDTLNELAAALGDDANFSTTVTNSIATKLPLAGGTMTGNILLNNAIQIRSNDTGGSERTITRVNSSNELEYGWSGNGPVKFMGGGSYAEKMRIHTNGNVGIGETNPQYKLHLSKPGSNYIQIDNDTNSVTSFLGVATDHLWLGTSTNHQLKFYANSDIKMVIDTNGKVGIGTVSPITRLTVGDGSGTEVLTIFSGSTGEGQIRFADGTSGSATYQGRVEYDHTNNILRLGAGGGTDVAIDANGNMDLTNDGANLKLYYNNAGQYSANLGWRHLQLGNNGANYIVAGNTSTGGDLYFVVNNTTDLSTNNGSSHNGIVAMHIDSTGKVGIGTETPGSTLDVRGEIRLDSGGSTSRSIYFRNQNSSSTGGGQIRSDQHLSLHAGNGAGSPTQYVTIKPGGNVGIGTTNPSALQQNYIDSGSANLALRLTQNNSGQGIWMEFQPGNNTDDWQVGANNAGFAIYNQTDSRYDMVIKNDGNVGIGTDNPGQQLDVRGSIGLRRDNGLLFFTDANTNGATNVNAGFIGMAHNAGYHVTSNDGGFSSNANSLLIGNYHSSGGDIILATTNSGPYPSGRVIIKENGSVGIGITPHSLSALTIGGSFINSYTSTIYLDNNNTGGQDGWINTTDDSWTLKTNAQQGGLAIGTSTPSSASAKIHIANDGTITMGKSVQGYVGTSGDSNSQLHVTGPITFGHGNTSEWKKGGRRVLGWYSTSYHSSGSYTHIETDLYGGSGSNSDYIMGGFEIRGYRYANPGHSHEVIGFHNWSGGLAGYNVASMGNWTAGCIAYVGSNGYVYIRLPNFAYVGFIMDLYQYAWYPIRDIKVVATHANSTANM